MSLSSTIHRDVFFMHNGPGPWPCYFCSKSISIKDLHCPRRGKRRPNIHHIDEDKANNDPGNLALAHSGCHSAHHAEMRIITDVARRRMSKAAKARVASLGPPQDSRSSAMKARDARKAWTDGRMSGTKCKPGCGCGRHS